jgi:hypothetical protein
MSKCPWLRISAGNTWEVFAVRVWFVAYLAWTLNLPGNNLPLPALGVVAGVASLAGVPASIAVAELASLYGRRRAIVATCLVSVLVCLTLAVTACSPILPVLTLLVLVQITSFADVGALAGGAVAAAEPARRARRLPSMRWPDSRPALSVPSWSASHLIGSAVLAAPWVGLWRL